MKYLNNYKIFENKEQIDAICNKYGINIYTINEDDSIDVNGSVMLPYLGLNQIPLKFRNISVDFYAQQNNLESLIGGPKHVDHSYWVYDNKITSLSGAPEYVGGTFSCSGNGISSLEGGPKYVGDNFYCDYNNITSLEGYPEYVGGSIFDCKGNPIHSVVKYFIKRNDRDNLVELFNYYDIVQGTNIMYDRLKYFYEGIDIILSDELLQEMIDNGYTIIK